MPDNVTSAIEASIRASENPDQPSSLDTENDLPDAPESSPADDTSTPSDDTPAEPDAVSPSAATVVEDAPVVPEPDALTKELDELGLKAPKAGERENRLPYSRVKKIVENARKKLVDSHTSTLAATTKQLTAAQARNTQMDNVDRLIVNDPDRYISELARIHPNLYGKFLKPAVAEVAPPVIADKPPGPDAKFPDGSEGYSPEGLEKLREWDRAQAVKAAVAETEKIYTKRFGPIEQQWKTQQVLNEKLPVVRGQIAEARATWGDLFTKNENEITQYLREHPAVAFGQAVAAVLVPKAQSQRDAMRAEILKEINARPKAVSRVPASSVAASKTDPAAPRSTEQVIADAVAASGLK